MLTTRIETFSWFTTIRFLKLKMRPMPSIFSNTDSSRGEAGPFSVRVMVWPGVRNWTCPLRPNSAVVLTVSRARDCRL